MVEMDLFRDHLGKLDTHKSMGPSGMCPQILREWAEAITKLHCNLYRTGEVHEDCRKVNVIPVLAKGKK